MRPISVASLLPLSYLGSALSSAPTDLGTGTCNSVTWPSVCSRSDDPQFNSHNVLSEVVSIVPEIGTQSGRLSADGFKPYVLLQEDGDKNDDPKYKQESKPTQNDSFRVGGLAAAFVAGYVGGPWIRRYLGGRENEEEADPAKVDEQFALEIWEARNGNESPRNSLSSSP
jgi:hypothetical protein